MRPSRAALLWGTAAALLVLVSAAAPLLVRAFGLTGPLVRDPSSLNFFGDPTGPSSAHPLGVDSAGRDELARILYGLRSMLAVALAGSAAAVLVGSVVVLLGRARFTLGAVRPGAVTRFVVVLVGRGIAAFPAVLLALLLGAGMSPGIWRLILAIGVALLPAANAAMERLPAADPGAQVRHACGVLVDLTGRAVLLYTALTFLRDGQIDAQPQLGTMLADAGNAMLKGVPDWWALLFPGLVVAVAGFSIAGLARTLNGPPSPERVRSTAVWLRFGRGFVQWAGDRLIQAVARAIVVVLLAILVAGSLHSGETGAELGASASVLLGALVVWLLLSAGAMRLAVRSPRLVARVPTRAVAAAPVAWLALASLYVFSESIGKIPILPGAATYVTPGRDFGSWLGALVMPWLLLGLTQAAALAPILLRAVVDQLESPRHRVAAAAGVSAAQLRRDDIRAAAATLLASQNLGLARFLAAAVVIEVAYQIPGVGSQAVGAFADGHAAGVAAVAVTGAGLVLVIGLATDLLRAMLDPGVSR